MFDFLQTKEYMNRAEEIKSQLKPHRDENQKLQRSGSRSIEEELGQYSLKAFYL